MARVTRPSTANSRPGEAHNRYSQTRRSSAEVQAAKLAAEAKKAEAAVKKQAVIKRIAQLETQARTSVKEGDLHANHPQEKTAIPRRFTRGKKDIPKAEVKTTGTGRGRQVKAASTKKQNLEKEDEELDEAASPDDEGVEAAGIDSDSEAPRSPENSEELVDDEDYRCESEDQDVDMDMEHDEPDTTITTKAKGSGKKTKKGLEARNQINMIASQIAPESNHGLNSAENKRKAGPSTAEQTGPKKARPPHPSGLIRNWEDVAPIHPSLNTPTSTTRFTITPARTPAVTRGYNLTPAAHHGSSELEDTPAFEPGGISSDDEGTKQPPATGFQFRSIAKVEEVHTAPSFQFQQRIRNSQGRRPNIRDLPHETQFSYNKYVQPMACDMTGALRAWEHPRDVEIIELWNECITVKGKYEISTTTFNDDGLYSVVKRLIKQNGIAVWQNRLAAKAKEAVTAEFKIRSIDAIEDRAKFVAAMLGPYPTDLTKKDRPYLWQSTNHSFEKEREGLFQGRLVASTFASHVMMSASVPDGHRVLERPVGALIMSLQAVHRALLYFLTGEWAPPLDHSESAFSKANWDDYVEPVGPKGEGKLRRRASVFLPEVDALTHEQWDDIVIAALATRSLKKAAQEVIEIHDASDDDTEVLVDPRYASKAAEVLPVAPKEEEE